MLTTMKRTKSSSRFDPYYKLQWFDEISFAWKDIQKAYATPEDARKSMHDGKTASWWRKHGAKSLEGFQLRYIYFLDKSFQDRLTVPILPFSEIDRLNARMYKGEKI